jgi:polyisoprenoid-binding protein YceI
MRPAAALLALWLAACSSGAPTPTASPPPSATPEPGPTREPAAVEPVASPTPPVGPLVFEIQPEGTRARFRIDERLRNRPNTVVGQTDRVAGRIVVDPAAADQAQLGPITIEAGSFVTDDELRDSSIRGLILGTAAFPTIVFTPTSIQGLPQTAAPGDRLTFDLTGELSIRDVTREVVFRVVLTVGSFDRLSGEARAVVRRSDFGLTIPSVPNVAEVAEEVHLELDFAAVRVP